MQNKGVVAFGHSDESTVAVAYAVACRTAASLEHGVRQGMRKKPIGPSEPLERHPLQLCYENRLKVKCLSGGAPARHPWRGAKLFRIKNAQIQALVQVHPLQGGRRNP